MICDNLWNCLTVPLSFGFMQRGLTTIVFALYKELVLVTFDPVQAEVIGLPVGCCTNYCWR